MSTQSFFIFFLLMPIFIAQSCNVSQYIDPTTKNCTDCPQNCTKCYFDTNINSVYCAKCRENNGFNLLQKKCVLCPPGCTNCFYYGALTDQILIALNKDLRVLFGVESKCMVCPVINNVQLTFFQNTCVPDCRKSILGCIECDNTFGMCLKCNYGYNLVTNKCELKMCNPGFYNIGMGCLPCSSNCKTCSSTACLTCPSGMYLTRGICKIQNDIDLIDLMITAKNETFLNLLDYQSFLTNKFKARNDSDFVACSKDADCLNGGKCMHQRDCLCKIGFYGTFCELTQKEANDSIAKNNAVIDRLSVKTNFTNLNHDFSLLIQSLREMTYVKAINDLTTMQMTLDLLDKVTTFSTFKNPDEVISVIGVVNNIFDLLKDQINASNTSSLYDSNKKILTKALSIEINNKFVGQPYAFYKLFDKNIEVILTLLDGANKYGINDTFTYISDMEKPDYLGGIHVNDYFLNQTPNASTFTLSLIKFKTNPYEGIDKLTKISSPILSVELRDKDKNIINITDLPIPIQIEIPRIISLSETQTWVCNFWNSTTKKWSSEKIIVINETTKGVICQTNHFSDFGLSIKESASSFSLIQKFLGFFLINIVWIILT